MLNSRKKANVPPVDWVSKKYVSASPAHLGHARASSRLTSQATNHSFQSSTHIAKQPLYSLPQLYLYNLPVLFFGCLFYGVVVFIFLNVEPYVIQDMPIKNSYTPLFVLSFLGHFFAGSYLFMNTRRGLEFSLLLSLLLFQRIFNGEIGLLLVPVLLILLLESFLTLRKTER